MENKQRRRPRRYTVKQAAERLGFSESFVRDLIENGEIGHIRRQTKSGSSIRIRERDIEQWEEQNSVCPDLNRKNLSTDSGELMDETTGISLGRRGGVLEENPPEPLMNQRLDENWNATLQSKLDRLRGKSESTES